MPNGQAAAIWFEVALRHIRLMLGFMREHVIPGKVLGWPRTGHRLIPLLGSTKVHIYTDDHTSVIEQLVLHYLSD